MTLPETTPCGPLPSQCDAESGEPCPDHEREQAHTEGEHAFCASGCSQPATPAAPDLAALLAADLRYVLDYTGPGHAHMKPGVWDSSGEACEHCARLAVARASLKAAEERPAAAPTSRQSEWCAAADALDEGTARFIAEWPDGRQSPYMQGRRDAAAYLRTLAEDAGQPGKQRCTCGGWFPISHIRADTHSPAADEAQQPDQFTEAERGFLAYALHLADEQMATGGGKFSDEDRAALVTFQRPAKAGCTCDPIGESWVEMPHAADCPMTEQCPGCGHDQHVGFCVTLQPTGAQGKPEECGCLDNRPAEGAQR